MAYVQKRLALASIKKRDGEHYGRRYVTYEAYLGTNPDTHKPVRISRASRVATERAVNEFYDMVDFGGQDAARLTRFQAADALNAVKELTAAGSDATLTICVRAYLKRGGVVNTNITLGEAYKKYFEEKKHQSAPHANTVRTRVGRWVDVFGASRKLAEVSAPEVAADLETRLYDPANPKTVTTYNGNLEYIISFMNWCTYPEQAYLAANPLKGMREKTRVWTPPEFVRAANVKRLFDTLAATPDAPANKSASNDLAYAILSFFCGMRPSEIERASEGPEAVAIDIPHRNIRVLKCKGHTKGVQPRSFTIPQQALAWMLYFGTRGVSFMDAIAVRNKQFRVHICALADKLGFKMPSDAGRHTFCTMYDAVHHDPVRLRAIVGNDEKVRANHYNGLTFEDEGREYFKILPPVCEQ